MSERNINEINEKIRNLREQLAGSLMSAEKEYKIRFEISDLQYESLQIQIDDLNNSSSGENARSARNTERIPKYSGRDDEGTKIQTQIDDLEFDLLVKAMTTDKQQELTNQLHQLKEIQSQRLRRNSLGNSNSKSLHLHNEIKELKNKIERLEMDQQTRVMNTDKERELIEQIKLLTTKIKDLDSESNGLQYRLEESGVHGQNLVRTYNLDQGITNETNQTKGKISESEANNTQIKNTSDGISGNLRTGVTGSIKHFNLNQEDLTWAIEFRERRLNNHNLPKHEEQNIIEEIEQLRFQLERQ